MGEKAKGAAAEEEKGVCASIGDALKSVFFGILDVIATICKAIVFVFKSICSCLEFIWYPIKERCAACCRWCGNKKNRSNDPHYSLFDNEVWLSLISVLLSRWMRNAANSTTLSHLVNGVVKVTPNQVRGYQSCYLIKRLLNNNEND